MEISCAFATSLSTPEQIALAERLGYSRAWCYDSPPLYPDVWMTLALAAERTSVIGLGPGVLIPHLRHVMTNAAAIATLEAHAPGRVNVAIGSGFTGRLAMGKRPMSWRSVRSYIAALQALLRGEEVEWDDSVIKMLHLGGFAPPRPMKIPMLVAASGPKGLAVAAELGDGIIRTTTTTLENQPQFKRVAQMTNGTVLEAGEAPDSERVIAATGHGAALAFHSAYETGQTANLPGGVEYARQVDALPARSRHLTVHDGHLVTMNALDRQFVTPEFMARLGRATDAETWRARLDDMEKDGVTEVVYQAAGPDIPRELTAFATMAGLQPRSP